MISTAFSNLHYIGISTGPDSRTEGLQSLAMDSELCPRQMQVNSHFSQREKPSQATELQIKRSSRIPFFVWWRARDDQVASMLTTSLRNDFVKSCNDLGNRLRPR